MTDDREAVDPAATSAPQPPAGPAGLPDAYVIPRALAQATLDYLAAQPYREVYALVRGFEALEPAPDAPGDSRPR